MKLIDYQIWEEQHFDAFPQTAEWMGARRDIESTRAAWQKSLADVELKDCQRATEAFLRGDEEPPKLAQDWPRCIRKLAQRYAGERRREAARGRYFDGELSYRCLHCQDTGLVWVWHPISIEAFRSETLAIRRTEDKAPSGGNVPSYSAVVACTCDAGHKRLAVTPLRFDERRMPLWIGHDRDANLASLEQLAAQLPKSLF